MLESISMDKPLKSSDNDEVLDSLKGEEFPYIVEESQSLLKKEGSFQESKEASPNDTSSPKSEDSCSEGSCYFLGASHPLEPIDSDLMGSAFVEIDENRSQTRCLMKSLSLKGLHIEDFPVRIPANGLGFMASPLSVPCASRTIENSSTTHDSEEKECVWDASLPPSGNVSPFNSIYSANMETKASILNGCLSPYKSDGVTSIRSVSVEKNCESAKESAIGDSLGSTKTSISRASDSSSHSNDSTWSSLTGSVSKPHKGNDPKWKAILAIRTQDGMLGMKHFRLLRKLGCGDIGSVYLSELSGTRCFFAMKVMDKASLVSRKKLARAQTEREILQLLDHPFLPTLYTHFETDRFSCLVMEFCPGGDLHTLRQRQPGKHFSVYAARFYAAEVLLALEYLHMLGIVYRDLKPENVLVRDDGHIMLSDFDLSLRCSVSPTVIKISSFDSDPSKPSCINPNSSCIQPSCFLPRFFPLKTKSTRKSSKKSQNHELVAEPTAARSMSFVGTHEYLAPEIIKGEGHGSAVDWWTFGIFIYELLYGKTPFKGPGNRATLFNVVGQQLNFPDAPSTNYSSRDLIRGLLMKEPQHRLGVKRGATEIKQHPFFEGVNWALIRCSTPPDVPKPKVEIDVPMQLGAGVGSSSKRIVGTDVKSGGKFLDFEFF